MEKLQFAKKRDTQLITPCCKKSNKDGKFVSYKGFEGKPYGYCHSCGSTTFPNNEFKDSNFQNSIEEKVTTKQKYINESEIWKYYSNSNQNNLISYLFEKYNGIDVKRALEYYTIGTDKNGGSIFWYISKTLKIQKSKVCFYKPNGKRTDKFYVPYKNRDGYFFCLFGEHLIVDDDRGKRILILVESEKTAIIGEILMPKYTWLAYSGINGLTNEKIKALEGHRVIIIPDLSQNAMSIIQKKLPLLKQVCSYVDILDLRNGKSDEVLKQEGIYNDDLEDFIRNDSFNL
jgi:hypothetical protein